MVPKKVPRKLINSSFIISPGESLNDDFDLAVCTIKYATFDMVMVMLMALGPSMMMAKCDITLAFRLLLVHPDDFNLLSFMFQGSYCFDKALPMGCSISCAMFEQFNSFLQSFLITRADCTNVTHYLNDLLLAANSPDCPSLLQHFMDVTGFGLLFFCSPQVLALVSPQESEEEKKPRHMTRAPFECPPLDCMQ